MSLIRAYVACCGKQAINFKIFKLGVLGFWQKNVQNGIFRFFGDLCHVLAAYARHVPFKAGTGNHREIIGFPQPYYLDNRHSTTGSLLPGTSPNGNRCVILLS